MEGKDEVRVAPLPPKRTRRSCIFHCNDQDQDLRSPRDRESWETIVKAAEIRKHTEILEIAQTVGEDGISEIFYHRNCRSKFTMKHLLDAIVEKKKAESDNASMVQPEITPREFQRRTSVIASTSSRVYEPICIFCQTTKYIPKTHTRRSLRKCEYLKSDESVRRAASEKNDTRIIALLTRELVAAEGHYHHSCYKDYTRKSSEQIEMKQTEESDGTGPVPDPEMQYFAFEKLCYDKLFKFIRDVIFETPKVVKLVELTKKLSDWLLELGVEEVKLSTKKHIRRKLTVEFGESLHMVTDSIGRVLVYPDNLSLVNVLQENQKLKDELHLVKQDSTSVDGMFRKVSTLLRKDMTEHNVKMPWPPLPEEMEKPSVYVPNSLTNFLKLLFCCVT